MTEYLTPEEVERINENARAFIRKIAAVPEADRKPMSDRIFGEFADTQVGDEPPEADETA
ncbi:MAG: hypothetical protein M3N46_02575 [Actinomycetota bacterium]|nr:hypothetical protein [Actinomycetota bacterium]